jgi:hypothetical protein
MNYRVQKDDSLFYVVDNNTDLCAAVFKTAKYAKRLKEFLNSGGPFEGPPPPFFFGCGILDYTNEDRHVGQSKS